jgi:hypothetical protein
VLTMETLARCASLVRFEKCSRVARLAIKNISLFLLLLLSDLFFLFA